MKGIQLFVLAYNNVNLIEELLGHIKESSILNLPIDIHIVDNGSSDNTAEIVKSFDFIKYHRIPKNLYFSGGANHCLSLSKADHIFFMNSDVIPNERAFREIISMAESDVRLGIIGCKSRLMTGDFQDIVKRFPSCLEIHALHGCISKVSILRKLVLSKYSRPHTASATDNIVDVVQDSFIYIRGDLVSLGLRYDSRMRLYYTEDYICEETRKMGFLVGFCGRAEVMHYSGATADQRKKSIRNIYDDDAIEFVKQKYGLMSSWILRADILLRELLSKLKIRKYCK